MTAPLHRACPDIGMFSLDRSIPESCIHATKFCRTECYNDKLYRIYPNMRGRDTKNEASWAAITPDAAAELERALQRKKSLSTDRLRLMTRGEALRDIGDIARVRAICEAVAPRLVWLPTRAWRNPILRAACEGELSEIPNLVILASIDPTTEGDWRDLASAGWSTMYFGDDDIDAIEERVGLSLFKCPKTWRGIKGHCASCKAGCFAPNILQRQVHVHLRQH